MSNEISQLDVSGIQLRDSRTQPRVSLSREIGEAEVIHDIFGRAKVRIIRKHDNFWRSLWLAVTFCAAAVSTYLFQGWYAARHAESISFAIAAPAVVHESKTPASAASATPPSPVAVPEPGKPVMMHKNVTQQIAVSPTLPVVAQSGAVPARPVVAQPKPVVDQVKALQQTAPTLPAAQGKPPAPPATTVDNLPRTPLVAQPAARPLPPKLPSAPVAAPPVAKTLAASSPVVAPVSSVAKEKTEPMPAAEKQLSSPLSVQGN